MGFYSISVQLGAKQRVTGFVMVYLCDTHLISCDMMMG